MNIEFTYDIPETITGYQIDEKFPNVKKEVILLGFDLIRIWDRIAQEEIPGGSGRYRKGIQKPETIDDGWGIDVTNVAPYAQYVEEGHPGFHLPSKINWFSSPGVKYGKKGPYLIIPFKHYSPVSEDGEKGDTYAHRKNALPVEIYRAAVKMTTSYKIRGDKSPMLNEKTGQLNTKMLWGGRIVQQGPMLSVKEFSKHGSPQLTPIGSYGQRQFIGGEEGLFESQREHWKFSKFAGLVHTGTKRSKKSPTERHGGFVSFRIIKPDSPHWDIPAMMGKHIGEKALTEVSRDMEERIFNALMKDITFA